MRDAAEPRQPAPQTGNDSANTEGVFGSSFEGENDIASDPRLIDPILGFQPRFGWMGGSGRARRRAMMTMMMMDPRMEGNMEYGGGWGFGGRFGHRERGRGGHRQGRGRYGVGGEPVAMVTDQFNECCLDERCQDYESDSSESSSSSSSSSDSESEGRDAPRNDGEPAAEKSSDVAVEQDKGEGETQNKGREGKEDPPRPEHCTNGCDHKGRGHRHGHRRKHCHGHRRHGHWHHHPHGLPPPPHPHCPPPPPHFWADYSEPRKVFKKSMKHWYKAQKKAWKLQAKMGRHRRQRQDGDEATYVYDGDFDPMCDVQHHLPPPWLFFPHHFGFNHGWGRRRGCGCGGKKERKKGKRRGTRDGEQPAPRDGNDQQTVVADEAAPVVIEGENGDQAPMEN